MFNFAIFSYLKMGGKTSKQLTIQVSRARPPDPAWLRRFKHKFRLAFLVVVGTIATAHWTQVNGVDYWTTDAARVMLYCLPTRQVPSVRCLNSRDVEVATSAKGRWSCDPRPQTISSHGSADNPL